jgi:hypothetical protein
MLTGGQKYRHNEDDYDGNDNDNKLLQHLVLKLMILMKIIMTIDSHNRYNLHIFARLVVIARSINTIEG